MRQKSTIKSLTKGEVVDIIKKLSRGRQGNSFKRERTAQPAETSEKLGRKSEGKEAALQKNLEKNS